MNSEKAIQDLLNGIGTARNRTGNIFLNSIRNEFITLAGRETVPRIPVKELSHDETALRIVEWLVRYIPEFLAGHSLLADRVPPSFQHSLMFVRKIDGAVMRFLHLLRIDLRFEGDSANIVERGDSLNYPSYLTDRIYYKSRLIPVESFSVREDGCLDRFRAVRIFDGNYVDSDQYFHTYAIFDDINTRDLTAKIYECLDPSLFPFSKELYPFVEFDYFTACLNVLHPDEAALSEFLKIFEPLFLYIYGSMKELDGLVMPEMLERFDGSLTRDGSGAVRLAGGFADHVRNYFSKISLYRDDDLAIRGWRRFDFAR